MFFLAIVSCKVSDEAAVRKSNDSIVLEEYIYQIADAKTPQCHASTIAESNGILVTSWFGGTEEKNDDVGIWVSRKLRTNGLYLLKQRTEFKKMAAGIPVGIQYYLNQRINR